ncbi:hypothetical protein [Streptomyces sp. NPDC000410]|uniref:hypothetical protein n=1 Tax=Streptomyces sp. NPDC000410 TaxID=3154254 RepID=UPI00332C7918
MRTRAIRATVTKAAAVTAALLVLTACGGGDGDQRAADEALGVSAGQGGDDPSDPKEGTLENPSKNGGVNGSAPDDATGFAGLPVAGSMKAAADFVSMYAACEDLGTNPEDERFYEMDAEYDSSWGVTERGVCSTGQSDQRTRIFMAADMKKFQSAFKATNKGAGPLIGQDFVVRAVGDDDLQALIDAGLLRINCEPGFDAPSGYKKEPALVEGCVLTDYSES